MRVSYNDYKLYLSILESVSKQLNKAIKSEANANVAEEIPDHHFDGKFLCSIVFRGKLTLMRVPQIKFPQAVRPPLALLSG